MPGGADQRIRVAQGGNGHRTTAPRRGRGPRSPRQAAGAGVGSQQRCDAGSKRYSEETLHSPPQRPIEHGTCLRQRDPRRPRSGGGLDVHPGVEKTMTADVPSSAHAVRDAALGSLAASAAANIPGVDFASITVQDAEGLRTLAATDPLAEKVDALQYDLREGPCYAAV